MELYCITKRAPLYLIRWNSCNICRICSSNGIRIWQMNNQNQLYSERSAKRFAHAAQFHSAYALQIRNVSVPRSESCQLRDRLHLACLVCLCGGDHTTSAGLQICALAEVKRSLGMKDTKNRFSSAYSKKFLFQYSRRINKNENFTGLHR